MRTLVAVALILAVSLGGLKIRDGVVEKQNATIASGQFRALLKADIQQVPAAIKDMTDYRQWTVPLLKTEFQKAADDSPEKLKLALALLPVDSNQVDYLYSRLLVAAPSEVVVVRDALVPHKQKIVEELWQVVQSAPTSAKNERLPAASALALYHPADKRWSSVAVQIVDTLVDENPLRLGTWMSTLNPVRGHLVGALAGVYRNRDAKYSETGQIQATSILEQYAADNVAVLADLVMDGNPKQFVALFDELQNHGVAVHGLRPRTVTIYH